MANASHGGNTAATVWNLCEPVAAKLDLDLWDVRFLKEGASWYLRIFIDKEGGVSLDDCEAFSRAIDPVLEDVYKRQPLGICCGCRGAKEAFPTGRPRAAGCRWCILPWRFWIWQGKTRI